MTRDMPSQNSIALLATGDEIVNGDVINSNAYEIAQRLLSNGMQVGMHLTVPDNLAAIRSAIQFLLQHHRALILTGGLGPTTDDLTRYALAETLGRELLFDEPTWQRIVDRLTQLGYSVTPENNRQQALFPEGAIIIPNSHGTASGCLLKDDEHFIFMLPGPPGECLPMVDKVVVPALEVAAFKQQDFRASWLLFGVSEGHIAEELEALAKRFDCTTGYRVCYPYVEIKLRSTHESDFNALVSLIEEKLAVYMIGDGKQTASELLKKTLLTLQDMSLTVIDSATGGSLEATLKAPDNCAKLRFCSHVNEISTPGVTVRIQGLEEFWQHKKASHTKLEITFSHENIITPGKFTIPYRGTRVKLYAVEFICQKIYQHLLSLR